MTKFLESYSDIDQSYYDGEWQPVNVYSGLAKTLYHNGVRIIPKDSLVITQQEYLNTVTKTRAEFEYVYKDKVVLPREEYEKEKLKLFAKSYNQGSKETAGKFAKKLENGIDNLDIILHEDNDEQYVSINQLLEFIDEIEKTMQS
jgi:hypothetical protein